MVFAISTADDRPIYLQIMDEIRRAIVIGTLKADEPLPSVRQMSAELRVNPNTVQQAYRELEREGVVYVRRGQGTYVAEALASAEDRSKLAHGIAERALREAYRNGVGAAELIETMTGIANADARVLSSKGRKAG